jgi:hypothetical protein
MLPKDHITSWRRVRIATVTRFNRTKFPIGFGRTEANTVLRYVEVSEDLLLKPIGIVASLCEVGGRQGFIDGLVMGVLDIHMVIDLQDDVDSV